MSLISKIKKLIQKNTTLVLVISTFIFELLIYISGFYFDIQNTLIFVLLLLYGTLLFCLIRKKKINFYLLIYIIGVFIRTIYILKTSVYDRQHDGLDILDNGHLGYIYTIYKTHQLPATNAWQFYHPPLWHIIGAIWLTVNNLFEVDIGASLEGLQIFTCMFSSFIVIIVNYLCIKLKLKDKYRYLTLMLFATNPKLLFFSGMINNDCLLLLLEAIIIVLLIKWYENSSYKNTILLAITTGLCVMTKANGAIMSIPILYVFIKKLLQNKEEIKTNISKILVFGFISLPIGLWYQVRNLILFSSNNIATPKSTLYIGNHSVFSRLIIIDFKQLFNESLLYNYNLPAYLIRSTITGELDLNSNDYFSKLFILLNFILIVISLYCIIKYLINKKKNITMNILLVTWITSLVLMYIFNIRYPYICSMDFRYITITLIPGILIIFYTLNKLKDKRFIITTEIVTYLFILLSILYVFSF